jgi:diketogulonate reductase-like aldo/keto reductase
MVSRPIPKSGETLPVIGLGTWQTFDVTNNDAAALENLRAILQALFDGGGKMIDSSPMYGRAEAVTGELLARMHARERAFLATKVWTSGRAAGIAEMRRSSELLKTRIIDLMQIHNLVDWRTQLATLRQMKEAGQVRYIGITHYTPSAFGDLAGIIEREEIDFVQLPYSIDVREAEKRMLPLAAERGVAVMVNRPFGGGSPVSPGARKSLAAVGGGGRMRELGAVLPQIYRGASGGHVRDSCDQRPGASGRRSQSGIWADAGRRYAPPDGRGIRCEVRSLGTPVASPSNCPG